MKRKRLCSNDLANHDVGSKTSSFPQRNQPNDEKLDADAKGPQASVNMGARDSPKSIVGFDGPYKIGPPRRGQRKTGATKGEEVGRSLILCHFCSFN